jgi:hypothetical protein
LAVVVTGALALVLLVSGSAQSTQGRLLFAMTPYLVAYAVFPDWWLRASGMLGTLSIANWCYVLSFLVALLLLPKGSSVAYALAYGLAPLAGAVVAWYALARRGTLPRFRGDWSAWLSHLRSSLLFAAAGASSQLSVPLTLVAMTAAGDARAAGAFAVGLRVAASAANGLWLFLQNALPRLLSSRRRITAITVLASALPPMVGIGVGALLWHAVIAPVLGPSYAQSGAFVALGIMTLAVWWPKYVVEIGLIASYADVSRILMNVVAPGIVIVSLLTGFSKQHAWNAPLVLLAAECIGATCGFRVLRRRQRTSSPS